MHITDVLQLNTHCNNGCIMSVISKKNNHNNMNVVKSDTVTEIINK